MKKKLQIYREEKCKADPYNHQANWNIEHTMRNLKTYLRKLAIKTIVFYPRYVNVLVDQSSFQSKEEISQEEEDFTGGGVCFGFLDKNDKGEVKFLHRTYAEYLFAKYLNAGFLPEKDKNYNKLLTSEPVRKMIFRKILIKGQYDGVRVFFNSMIKQCVPMVHLSRQIKNSRGILGTAITDQNANTFKFMCDCLDMSLSKDNIRRILSSNAFDPICDDPLFYDTLSYSMYEQNSEVFKRFIGYYDEETDETNTQRILNEMLYQPLTYFNNSELNQEERKKIVELVLGFLYRSREKLKQTPEFENRMSHILKFFICNGYYGSNLLKKMLELLSSVFSDGTVFTKFLTDTIRIYREHILNGNLEKTLTILRDLERNDVLEGIFHQIFEMDIHLFISFYQPKEETSAESDLLLSTDIQSLLVRDSYRMTRLHRAAL